MRQGAPAPLEELVQPAGSAGGVTPSKFSDKVNRCFPNRKAKLTVPKTLVPSWSWRVAILVSPQRPLAVKANGLLVVPPLAARKP